jgi:F-type H+-transporting ATPase subunit b
MPQFDFSVALPQVAWLVLAFGVLFLVMRSMLPRVEKVVETRARTIGDDLGAAEAARAEAERVDAEYQAGLANARGDALGVIGEAKAAAARETEARMKIVGGEIDARIKAADERIAGLRAEAMGKLDAVAADATADIVERLTGTRPSDADAANAVAAVAG